MFPVPNNPANTWVSPADVREMKMPETSILQSFENFAAYIEDVQKGQGTSNTDETAKWLNKISATQIQYSSQVMPSNSRVNAELLLNQLDVFGRLRNVYAMLSLILLGLFFMVYSTIRQIYINTLVGHGIYYWPSLPSIL